MDATSKLVKQIFTENSEMRATVEAQTIVDSDRPYYEPILKGMLAIDYNAFDGLKVEEWLRGKLMTGGGPVVGFRFGREYSPVLYLTVARAEKMSNGDCRKLTAGERRKITVDLMAQAKGTLEVDVAQVVSPGVIRLWWD